MERIDTGLDATSRAELLYRNRRRCCTCRNPAKAVGFYAVSTDQPRHLENLVVLCADCYILTLSCAQESGENSVKREVIVSRRNIGAGPAILQFAKGDQRHFLGAAQEIQPPCADEFEGGSLLP